MCIFEHRKTSRIVSAEETPNGNFLAYFSDRISTKPRFDSKKSPQVIASNGARAVLEREPIFHL